MVPGWFPGGGSRVVPGWFPGSVLLKTIAFILVLAILYPGGSRVVPGLDFCFGKSALKINESKQKKTPATFCA